MVSDSSTLGTSGGPADAPSPQTIISRNPSSGAVLRELSPTPFESLPSLFAAAKEAQIRWAALPIKRRSETLIQIREALLNQADDLIELLSAENGKPRFESLSNELLPSADLITYFAKRAPKLLKDKKIRLQNLLHRSSYLNYWPLGVVVVISPWNAPFYTPFAEIIMALIAGNSVIFKPSEVTPLVGLKIQEICENAGLPRGLLQTVIGDGRLGAALVRQRPAKIFFTGSVATGRKVLAAAAENFTPVSLELGGKDAMIVLADADLDFATSAAAWGGFSNSGQICSSVERIIIHESVVEVFVDLLKQKLNTLKQAPSLGNAAEPNDLGAVTFENQKLIYQAQITEAKAMGARFVMGGDFNANKTALNPTIVMGDKIESTQIYNEETFGPVVAVTTFRSVTEAIEKANHSRYGLVASVITRNQTLGEQIARQLEVGTVTINEVTYTAGLPETPWGGIKESGTGRVHGDIGLYEFVNIRHIHKAKASFLVFKSLWWFPYTPFQYAAFRQFLELYRKSWSDKARAFPHFLWNFIQFIKREKRL